MSEDGNIVRPNVAEQPQDWTEPGTHAVVAGVHRIPLPLPLSGLRAVNVYVIDAPTGPVLVDSGWVGADGGESLEQGLGALGYRLGDVDRIVVTHAHHDHYTQALALRERFGSRVQLGRGELPSVEAMLRRRTDGERAPQPQLLRRAGATRLADDMATLLKALDEKDDAPWGAPDGWLDDGQEVGVGERRLEVRATPGHTRGHIVLRDAPAGLLFSGDHVLPHITPSIGYERAPEPAPLRSYLASLRLVRDLPDALMLPAHGPVSPSVHTRVDELLRHHEERLDASLTQLKAGASTAYEVAAGLPWTRRMSTLDDLETEHASLAVLEIAAHLDLLVTDGAVTACEVGGVVHYAPA
ncbi:MBL fold metallo-hydrolase [Pseudonocardia hispaniensis]|uniref:MBL fold metallo-hydrolase n=1 Tax=Pseudonocardia hispaniensis TaxID=904933 RepID=A0ABW1J310_9PSEU